MCSLLADDCGGRDCRGRWNLQRLERDQARCALQPCGPQRVLRNRRQREEHQRHTIDADHVVAFAANRPRQPAVTGSADDLQLGSREERAPDSTALDAMGSLNRAHPQSEESTWGRRLRLHPPSKQWCCHNSRQGLLSVQGCIASVSVGDGKGIRLSVITRLIITH